MSTKETKDFLFAQTCTIIAGRLSEGNATPPSQYISDHFEEIYLALQNEYKKNVTGKIKPITGML
ncbi:hypothetical protein ACMVR0_001303 [Yersinia enterocolitica]